MTIETALGAYPSNRRRKSGCRTPRHSGNCDEAWLWRLGQLDDLALLRAHYVAQAFPRHTHETFSIGINENTTTAFYCRGALRIAPAGAITIVNPGEVHTGQAVGDGAWDYRCFYPSPGLLSQIARDVFGLATTEPFFPNPVVNDPELGRLLIKVHRSLEAGWDLHEHDCRLVEVLGLLIARHALPSTPLSTLPGKRPAAIRVREYIDANCKHNIPLARLAAVVGMSKFHMLRVFKLETGLTPGEYQTQLRVEEAKRLLAKGDPISFIASELGFSDQSHFTRRFKRWVGVTPGHYLQYRAADQGLTPHDS